MRRTIFVAASSLVIWIPAVFGQTASDALVGSWKLVSVSTSTEGGSSGSGAFGSSPEGVLTYTREGRMSVLIANGGRKSLSGDRLSAPAEERAEAFATFLAYAGRYSLEGNQVTHHVELSSFPNWVSTDLVRGLSLEGDRITLTTPPLSVGGKMQTTKLVWERMKS